MTAGRTESDRKESLFEHTPLDSEKFKNTLNILKEVVKSCFGPNGQMKIIHNNIGGPLTITSTSSRLLPGLSELDPIVKFILTSIQGHLNIFSDGGLYSSLLCIKLLEAALRLTVGRHFVIEWYQKFLEYIKHDIQNNEKSLKFKGDMTNFKFLKVIVKSILNTKPLCRLLGDKLDFLTCLVLETFLSLIKTENDVNFERNIHFITLDGIDVKDSKLYKGLLIEITDSSMLKLIGRKWSQMAPFPTNNFNGIKVVVITISLSGDLEEMEDCRYEIDDELAAPEEVIINQIIALCDKIVQDGVELILCQKVVHPRVKQFIRSQNVCVIDRLGLLLISMVKQLIGCQSIGSFLSSPTSNNIGIINSISIVNVGDRKLVHLQNADSVIGSLVLGHLQEDEVNELKSVVKSSLRTLEVLVQDPDVVSGAGCWEMNLAHNLKLKVLTENAALIKDDPRIYVHLLSVLHAFTSALHSVVDSLGRSDIDSYTDSFYHHLWRLPKGENPNTSNLDRCSCGLFKMSDSFTFLPLEETKLSLETVDVEQSCNDAFDYTGGQVSMDLTEGSVMTVLDCCKMKLSALTTAVTTACALLSIHQVITDIN